ncbi:pyruvate kinase [bacterium]|nr:pyruvate kinase [bacterium]
MMIAFSSRPMTRISPDELVASKRAFISLNPGLSDLEDPERLQLARKASKNLDVPVAIFQDLQGPKVRVGNLAQPSIEIEKGDKLIITTEPCEGSKEKISIDYPYLHEEVVPGNRILIDDGLILLKVVSVVGRDIETVVKDGGIVKPRKGVNLPDVTLHHLSSYTKKDMSDMAFAFENELDYIALSFVRSAADVRALKDLMLATYGRMIPIISKIEKPEAVKDIDAIINESGAIMIARGDLGVETSPEEVPVIQKSLIRACNLAGIPVITATQMLESMIQNARPTRAEAGDVANAILDGSSAVMLSGETAAGLYPQRTVEIMQRIIVHTEASLEYKRLVLGQRLNREDIELKRIKSTTEAVGSATRELALAIKASYIACFTYSGGSAKLISKFRPGIPIVGFSPILQTVQRLALAWGVNPVHIADLVSLETLLARAPDYLKEQGFVKQGDTIVVTAGVPVGSPGKTNLIKVVEID